MKMKIKARWKGMVEGWETLVGETAHDIDPSMVAMEVGQAIREHTMELNLAHNEFRLSEVEFIVTFEREGPADI